MKNLLVTKNRNGLHSIFVKIVSLVVITIVLFVAMNIGYIIPSAKKTIQTVNENNMQDLATLSASLVENQLTQLGEDQVTYDVLLPILDGYGLKGIDSSYIYVVDETGNFVYHRKPDKINTMVANASIKELLQQIPTGTYTPSGIYHYTDENGVNKYCSYQVIQSTGWISVCVADEKEIMASINAIRNIGILMSAAVALIALLVGFFASKTITKPIEILTAIIKRTGDLDFTASDELESIEENKDETGVMARAVADMEDSLRNIVERIATTSDDLEAHAQRLKQITIEIDSANSENSASSEELAASMEETSATTEVINERTQVIKKNADDIAAESKLGAQNAQDISRKAIYAQERTLEAKNATVQIRTEINEEGQIAIEKSKSVAKVNQLANAIQDIASQTNLLALNASIEAARAGDAGRGFAVVASEIGELAKQSSDAVSNIMAIVEEVEDSVEAMNKCLTRTLDYLETNVSEDYDNFLAVADDYRADATGFADSMTQITNRIEDLQNSTADISVSVDQITSTVGEAAIAVTNVAERATDVANLSDGVVKVVEETEQNSYDLRDIKNSFTI